MPKNKLQLNLGNLLKDTSKVMDAINKTTASQKVTPKPATTSPSRGVVPKSTKNVSKPAQKPRKAGGKSMQDVNNALKDKESITKTLQKGTISSAQAAQKSKDSMAWFYKAIKASRSEFEETDFVLKTKKQPFIGGLFHFLYDPKHKLTLPYYDMFPLVIPIARYNDGFLGLNLHYISPIPRAKLLDMLIERYKKTTSSRTYMKISYDLLKAASTLKWYEPCLHRYLLTHMRSKPVMITPDAWQEVAFLPTQQFVKASTRKVWADSSKRFQ